jgi:uncharacterized membrane protein
LSSTILFGTGIGSAFYMFFASRQPDPKVAHFVVRHVVLADWLFTTTAIIVQPVTGLWLAHTAGFPLGSTWLLWSIVLYFVAGACWLPVVWIQYQMRAMAQAAAESGGVLPPRFHRLFRIWVALGVPAFLALVAVFYLMVAKPA